MATATAETRNDSTAPAGTGGGELVCGLQVLQGISPGLVVAVVVLPVMVPMVVGGAGVVSGIVAGEVILG